MKKNKARIYLLKLFYFILFPETDFLCVAVLVVLELILCTKLASNS